MHTRREFIGLTAIGLLGTSSSALRACPGDQELERHVVDENTFPFLRRLEQREYLHALYPGGINVSDQIALNLSPTEDRYEGNVTGGPTIWARIRVSGFSAKEYCSKIRIFYQVRAIPNLSYQVGEYHFSPNAEAFIVTSIRTFDPKPSVFVVAEVSEGYIVKRAIVSRSVPFSILCGGPVLTYAGP